MELKDWLELKSGTDVRGVALEGVEGEHVNLTDEAVHGIVKALCALLAQRLGKTKLTIAIGHDSRLSADRICAAAAKAVTESGCDAVLTGLSSTPSMFMLLQEKDTPADASVMVTASHLPYNKNGLKFFLPSGGFEGKDITQLLTLAAEGKALPQGSGTVRGMNYIDRYSANLVAFVRAKTGEERPLSGKKIVVDAGNGAGGFYVDKVLKPLGADTEGSQFLDPDGRFPNHIPNPENKEAMRSVCEAVRNTGADFGIIFDTDVDRAGAVDKNGEEINRNRLIALISAILLEEHPGATIVTDSVTSDGLAQFIRSRGGTHCRYRRGYRNVIDKAKELCGAGQYAPIGIETSGHAALEENYFLDDGAYLVTRILVTVAKLAKKGRSVSDLIADLPEPAEAAEARLTFAAGADFRTLGSGAIEDLKKYVPTAEGLSLAPDNYEGVRINFDKAHGDGWALVRMSLHEPIMPINLESNQKGGNAKIAKALLAFLSRYSFLVTDNLKKCL